MLLLRASLVSLALAAALAASGAVTLARARRAGVHVLGRTPSVFRCGEPEDAEVVARTVLDASDNARCRIVLFDQSWRLPRQERFPNGGALSFAAFDGHPEHEASRHDPTALVVGDGERAYAAFRLPDNAYPPEVQVIDAGGARLVIVVQGTVRRGAGYCSVATWDPASRSVEKKLDTGDALGYAEVAVTFEAAEAWHESLGGITCDLEGLHVEVVPQRR